MGQNGSMVDAIKDDREIKEGRMDSTAISGLLEIIHIINAVSVYNQEQFR